MGSLSAKVYAHVRLLNEMRAAHLETVCEKAIQSGQHGVLIDGDSITVDARVPYGRIYDVTA